MPLKRRAQDGVRVSSGHLCEAEAPTEPAGETSNFGCVRKPNKIGVLQDYHFVCTLFVPLFIMLLLLKLLSKDVLIKVLRIFACSIVKLEHLR